MINQHASDCAVHNEPAYPAGPCDCHLSIESRLDQMIKHAYQGSTEAADEIRQELVERYKAMQPAPVQEPVAWASENVIPFRGLADNHACLLTPFKCAANTVPLYTDPPQREWVGLTDKEIGQVLYLFEPAGAWFQFAHAIEAKLRSKNNG